MDGLDYQKMGKYYAIESKHPHPKFTGEEASGSQFPANDIGLVKLKSRISTLPGWPPSGRVPGRKCNRRIPSNCGLRLGN